MDQGLLTDRNVPTACGSSVAALADPASVCSQRGLQLQLAYHGGRPQVFPGTGPGGGGRE